jgi:hypothetical protein
MSIYLDNAKAGKYLSNVVFEDTMTKLINENLISTTGTDASLDVASVSASVFRCCLIKVMKWKSNE